MPDGPHKADFGLVGEPAAGVGRYRWNAVRDLTVPLLHSSQMFLLYNGNDGDPASLRLVERCHHAVWAVVRGRATRTLQSSGETESAATLEQMPFELWKATDDSGQDFEMLYMKIPADKYQELQTGSGGGEYKRIAEALGTVGSPVRFVGMDVAENTARNSTTETSSAHLRSKWNRGDRLTVTGIVIAVIVAAVSIGTSFVVPEVRKKLKLEKPAPTPIASAGVPEQSPPPRTESKAKLTPKVDANGLRKDNVAGNTVAPNGNRVGNDNRVNSPSAAHNNALNGMIINGGTVNNPTINNYGPVPHRIALEDRPQLIDELSRCKGKVSISAPAGDNVTTQYAVDWYGVLQAAGWEMKEKIVLAFLSVGGPPFAGAQVTVGGEPLAPGEQVQVPLKEPIGCLAGALKSQNVPIGLLHDPKHEDGLVTLQFGAFQ